MNRAEMIEDLAIRANLMFRDEYSGRSMYGKECVGVEGEQYDYPDDMLQKLYKVADDDEREVLANLKTAQDNMGLGYILYFPDVSREEERDWYEYV